MRGGFQIGILALQAILQSLDLRYCDEKSFLFPLACDSIRKHFAHRGGPLLYPTASANTRGCREGCEELIALKSCR